MVAGPEYPRPVSGKNIQRSFHALNQILSTNDGKHIGVVADGLVGRHRIRIAEKFFGALPENEKSSMNDSLP